MLEFELNEKDGIVHVRPSGMLEREDMLIVTKVVDDYIDKTGVLPGLLIDISTCAGWHDMGAFTTHMNFIEKHHMKVARVAIVSDSKLLTFVPKIADFFLQSEVKQYSRFDDAVQWLLL
ncbi:MAG: STAS/SEC14 domain-containing protein [Sulfurimonadaceae bacterium]|nr:STAS/SEC14 domain-containing protein [Sulfurimonadaceae bacterium]